MMEWLLPELVAAQVAQHLSPRDLAACCGVSRHWRLIFDTDQVWKPLCDPHLEEPLRTTPCVVEPPFSLPEPPDSTLAPVCHWRAAFLREQHLQSNYRSGNYKTVKLMFEEKRQVLSVEFVSDDFLMVFYRDSVELLDVRVIPPIIVDKLAIGSNSYSVAYKNGFVILVDEKGRVFQVLKVDSTEGTIASKYWIYFTETSGSPEMVVSCSSQLEINRGFLFNFEIHTTSGTKCIGYFRFSNSFHIFELESGVKVREQFCPSNLHSELSIVGPKIGCNDCHDVLVFQIPRGLRQDLEQWDGHSIHCYVYDVERLVFWPFKHTHWCPYPDVTYSYLDALFGLMNDFIALIEHDNKPITPLKVIRIFNYKTGDQIHFMELNVGWPKLHVIDNSYFLLIGSNLDYCLRDRLFAVALPSGAVIEDFTGKRVENIKVIGRRQIIVESNKYVIWQIKQREKQKFVETALKFDAIPQPNQTGTRLIYKTYVMKKTMRLVYLW